MTLDHDTVKQLRNILLACDQFQSNADMRAIFADPALSAFRNHIPDGDNPAQRVDRLIAYLNGKQLRDGAYAMPRFLYVLADRYDTDDKTHMDLRRMADDLAWRYKMPDRQTPQPEPIPIPTLHQHGEVLLGVLRIALTAEGMRGNVTCTHIGGPSITDITCSFHPPASIAISPQSLRVSRIAAGASLQAGKITIGGGKIGQRIDLSVSLSYRQSSDSRIVHVSGILPIDVT